MAKTDYVGIDYGRIGGSNRDSKGFHFGVISQNDVLQAWSDSSEAYYGKPEEAECPECRKTFTLSNAEWGEEVECKHCEHRFDIELPDCAEPISHFIDDEEYKAECGDSGDIFITKSKFYTRAQFCSPCAPGAGYLMNPCPEGPKTYCFGHDWFEGQEAPYPVFRVDDDTTVLPDADYYTKGDEGEAQAKILGWGDKDCQPFVETQSFPTNQNKPVKHFKWGEVTYEGDQSK